MYVDGIFCYFFCFFIYVEFWGNLSFELKREIGWYFLCNRVERLNWYNLILKLYKGDLIVVINLNGVYGL